MGLKSFFQRKSTPSNEAPLRGRRAGAADAAEAVQQARTKARQRLIGAVVLLGIGVIGFPLLFETQPRPIPVDLPIEIPRKEGAAPLPLPAVRPSAAVPQHADAKAASASAAVIDESAADAGRELAPAPADKPAAKPPAPKVEAAASKPAEKPAARAQEPVAKPATRTADDAARAKALLDGKAAAESGRFVVQVGAFAENSAAHDTRVKLEKLGIKTYTQVVQTDAGKRIRVRVGPFATRDEADRAAAKIKAAGLAPAVLTL